VRLFCAQTQLDAQRLRQLGVANEKIRVTGNMKFDIIAYQQADARANNYRQLLGLSLSAKLWVAASTHPGEEEIILSVYKRLCRRFPSLSLIIAPRHPERAQHIADLIEKSGFQPLLISSFLREPRTENRESVFILDTIGGLLAYYGIADIVFVGGSLTRNGGHNILEPASLNKPVLFGPHIFNFRDITDLFLSKKAAIMISGAQQLQENIAVLLDDPALALAMGQAAGRTVIENRGACKENILLIKEVFGG
jgi:3-deoxy-D-manno-octulosonic-acid transferase